MKKFIPVYVRVPVLFAMVFMALEFFIDSGDRPAFLKYPLVSLFLGVIKTLIIKTIRIWLIINLPYMMENQPLPL